MSTITARLLVQPASSIQDEFFEFCESRSFLVAGLFAGRIVSRRLFRVPSSRDEGNKKWRLLSR